MSAGCHKIHISVVKEVQPKGARRPKLNCMFSVEAVKMQLLSSFQLRTFQNFLNSYSLAALEPTADIDDDDKSWPDILTSYDLTLSLHAICDHHPRPLSSSNAAIIVTVQIQPNATEVTAFWMTPYK